jgi:adenylosuccinate synthase
MEKTGEDNFKKLLGDAQVVAVYCNQWGDTGKGKYSDYFSEWADVIARGTGGNNAGHTVVVGGKQRIFHLLPAGIIYDGAGKTNVLGKGMVIDPKVLIGEIDEILAEGLSCDNLMISRDAHVIMDYQINRDKAKHQSQKKGGIGSTGRGIGPCYTDKVARRGVRMFEFLDENLLRKVVTKASEFYPEQEIDIEKIILETRPLVERLAPFVKNADAEMQKMLKDGKRVLIEGAQGLLLSIEHGTYPYVTSSDCSLNGMASGIGISAKQVDLALGIVKFPFMTRVGGGPFPTEFGGVASEAYCGESGHEKISELKEYGVPFTEENGKVKYDSKDPKIVEMMNSEDLFIQGVGVRLAAGEYGATTGRPRRNGWTDAVATKYAVGVNGPLLILTKADAVCGLKEFKICYGYKKGNEEVEDFQVDEDFMRSIEPKLKAYGGYEDIGEIREYDKLPETLKESISDFEEFTGGKVVIVGVGAERDATIVR